mmetsp:Transcript_9043/g.8508  ORF Transcript_9043/g.8508 Transcript_9043/m.8508 type:complete len:167 (-) Transcript_9043:424-924(-)
MHRNFKLEAESTIDILLNFTISADEDYKNIAFWALKDYILLNHDSLIEDLSGIIQAFVNGCVSSNEEINNESANAISFLITHHLVYKDLTHSLKAPSPEPSSPGIIKTDTNCILDALMYLTGSSSKFIRTRAFSTLSTLSTYASDSQNVMEQIMTDIRMPKRLISK